MQIKFRIILKLVFKTPHVSLIAIPPSTIQFLRLKNWIKRWRNERRKKKKRNFFTDEKKNERKKEMKMKLLKWKREINDDWKQEMEEWKLRIKSKDRKGKIKKEKHKNRMK